MSFARRVAAATACLTLALIALPMPAAAAQTTTGPLIIRSSHNDRSAPLISLGKYEDSSPGRVKPHRQIPGQSHAASSSTPATGVSTAASAPSTTLNFEGIGAGFSGPSGTFTVNSAPPDTNGATGPNHFIQTVNSSFAIFNKSGTAVYGPVALNTLWSGFGGLCETDNDGDPTVVYDRPANRFVISQFAVTGADGGATPFLQCVAVSQTADPTGAYYRYSFPYSYFNDYPKMAVWPDGYYVTSNKFNAAGTTFLGAAVAAMDRGRMLNGLPATQQVFSTSTSYGGLLPSHLDSAQAPPGGAPNHLVGLGASASNSIAYWNFHVDWSSPGSSSFAGPTELGVSPYSEACGGGTCIPQAGTRQRLDSLADRVMNRLAYRNFGDHEGMVVNHSVTAGTSAGVRWYELRVGAGNALSVFQQGTYAPDSNYRWMGSIALDQSGNMGLGYSTSSGSINPQIRYTGRLAGDLAGTMSQGEATLLAGAGSQTGNNLSRWGDYSSMTVDPADDCTFWYTNQYIPAYGSFNWRTRIGTFKFAGCGGPPPPNDFSISATPSSLSVVQGAGGTSTISTAVTSGAAQSITLSATGVPAGTTAGFNPNPVNAGSNSTLTLAVGSSTTPGSYSITVTGTAASGTHSTNVTLTVPPNDFSITANPTSVSVVQGNSATSTISTAVTSGAAQSVSLSASGLPAGATAGFSPTSVTGNGSSTLTLSTATSTATGSYTVTVTGTGSSATHTTTVTLTVTAPPANDFSISASPTSLSVIQGSSGTSTISTAVTSGSAQSVSLSASGLPAGATAGFNPTSITGNGTSTLTLTVSSSTAPGSYAITVTGTGASATHTTTVSLTVTAAPPPAGIVNGGFESGDLSGWTPSGTAAVVSSGAHSGTYAAQLGGTAPTNGDSTLAQTFTAPSAGGSLSFWYRVACPDSVTYDWATATLKDNTANTTSTLLPKTCTNTGVWVQSAAASLTGSHSYTLTLVSHDDNYPGDATYTLYDDVAIGAPAPPPPAGITNGDFETGTLSGWTVSGTASAVSGGHSGGYSARVGGTSPTNGDSSIGQTFTASTGTTTLGFWYKVVCPDTITYDWATATLRDNTSNTTTTVLARTCTNTGSWAQVTAAVTAGHSYTITLISHDDNYASDPTYTLYDDVTLV